MDKETIDFLYILGLVVVGILLIWRIYTDTLFDIVKGRAKVLPLLEVLGGIAAAFVILIASS